MGVGFWILYGGLRLIGRSCGDSRVQSQSLRSLYYSKVFRVLECLGVIELSDGGRLSYQITFDHKKGCDLSHGGSLI